MILAELENLTTGELTMALALAIGAAVTLGLAGAILKSPSKLSLRRSPSRENIINPLIVLGMFLAWLTAGSLFVLSFKHLNMEGTYKEVLASLATQFLIAAIILLMARKLFKHGLGSGGLGFSRKNIRRDIIIAVPISLACVAICMAVAWAVISLAKLISPEYSPKDHRFLEAFDTASSSWQIAIVISAVVGASLSEELIFRGMMQTALKNYASPWIAIIITSIIFAGVHAETQNMPSLFVLSFIIGWSYEKTGSITLPIFIHAIFNAVMISAKIV